MHSRLPSNNRRSAASAERLIACSASDVCLNAAGSGRSVYQRRSERASDDCSHQADRGEQSEIADDASIHHLFALCPFF